MRGEQEDERERHVCHVPLREGQTDPPGCKEGGGRRAAPAAGKDDDIKNKTRTRRDVCAGERKKSVRVQRRTKANGPPYWAGRRTTPHS